MSRQEQSFDLVKYLKMIFCKPVLFIVITLCIAILGTSFLSLVYNKNNKIYYTEFSVINGKSYTMPDGTKFIYTDFISKSNIDKTKASDPSFDTINTTKLYNKGAFKITRDLSDSQDSVISGSQEYVYTISVKAKYLDDINLSKNFLVKLAQTKVDDIYSNIESSTNDSYLVSYAADDSNSFSTKIDYLESQNEFLLGSYDALIDNYGGDYVAANNTSLSNLYTEIVSWNKTYPLSDLYSELSAYRYSLDNASLIKKYDTAIENLTITKTENKKKIEALKVVREEAIALYSGLSTEMVLTVESKYNDRIIELIEENIDIDHEIEVCTNYKANAGSQDSLEFNEKLNSYYDKLVEFTQKYTQSKRLILKNNAHFTFVSSPIVKTTGTMSLIKQLAITLFIGLALAVATNIVIYYVEADKAKQLNK